MDSKCPGRLSIHRGCCRDAYWTEADEQAANKVTDEFTASTGIEHGFWRPVFAFAFCAWALAYECSKCGHTFRPDLRQDICTCCETPIAEIEDKPNEYLFQEPKPSPLPWLKEWRQQCYYGRATAPETQ